MSFGEFTSLDPLNPPKDTTRAVFEVQPIKMEFASNEAGRAIYEDREYVRIIIPGSRLQGAYEPVNEGHIKRWPQEYAAFKAGREPPINGLPLTEWPSMQMTPSRVLELQHFNIRTVQELAAINDADVMKLGMGGRELRATAQKFMDVSKGMGGLERLVLENQRLRDEVSDLKRDLAEALTRAVPAPKPQETANV